MYTFLLCVSLRKISTQNKQKLSRPLFSSFYPNNCCILNDYSNKEKAKKVKTLTIKIEFNGFDLIRSNFILHTRYVTYRLKMTPKVTILQNRWKITMVNLIFLWALKPMGLFKGIFKSLNVQLLDFWKQFNCKSCWPKNLESGTQHFLCDHIST